MTYEKSDGIRISNFKFNYTRIFLQSGHRIYSVHNGDDNSVS